MKYTVQWNYKSSLGGPWLEGDVVEIDEAELAAAINRDSPGVLIEGEVKPPAKKDRQVKAAKTRTEPEDEVMTTENFGAVKIKK